MFERVIVCLGSEESEHTGNRERNRNPQEIRAVFAPSGIRPVSNKTHDRVRDSIIQLGHQYERTGMSKAQTENIGIEERQVVRENLPEHGRGHISESITDFLRESGFSNF